VASYVRDEIVAHRYEFLGSRDPSFQPEPDPASTCEEGGSRCLFFAPTELAVNSEGTVARSVKTVNSLSACDGAETVSTLAPGASQFKHEQRFTGCGISEVFSIETDPRGRFLVSGWGAPPAQAQFVRFTKGGRVDRSFGEKGVALGPQLTTDNLLLPDPAFGNRGAFYTAFTQPRTPTLELRPSRFSKSGGFSQRFEKRSQKVEFDAADAITDFAPAVTLRTSESRLLIVGTGTADAGPVPAIARWRAR
jgi:hypothetical protein